MAFLDSHFDLLTAVTRDFFALLLDSAKEAAHSDTNTAQVQTVLGLVILPKAQHWVNNEGSEWF